MSKFNLLSFTVVLGSLSILLVSTGVSQSTFKNDVALQSSTPGTSQSGHLNISGTARMGSFVSPGSGSLEGNLSVDGQIFGAEFIGDGSQLGNLSASNVSAGTLASQFLDSNVALKSATNTFAGVNKFDNYVSVGRDVRMNAFESFGVGTNSPNYDGMYIKTGPTGKPYYGYSLGGAISAYHYLDPAANNSWKLFVGNQDVVTVTPTGSVAIGGLPTTARLAVTAQDGIAGEFIANSATATPMRVENLDPSAAAGGAVFQSQGSSGTTLTVNNLAGGQGRAAHFTSGGPDANTVRVSITATGTNTIGTNGTALYAENAGYGGQAISGYSSSPTAVNAFVQPIRPTGVRGEVASGHGYGIVGSRIGTGSGYGVFFANSLGGTGTKSWIMDHPLRPETHILRHFSIESPEPYNVYRGNITTDSKGFATVQLPEYFESINADPSYHLTVIDDSDDFVMAKVVSEVSSNAFRIRTSKPNVKVSWRVEALRNDRWMKHHGAESVIEKKGTEVGRYLSPELYGAPQSAGWFYSPPPAQTSSSKRK